MNIGRLDFLDKLLHSKNRPALEELIEHKSLKGPKVVELDLTTDCNYKCSFCADQKVMKSKEFIKRERMLRLVEEMKAAGVQGVILIGGGEPLVYPYFDEVVQKFSESNIAVGLTTNGSLIEEHLDYIKKYVTWIRISVDAGTRELHSRLKAPEAKEDFTKVIKSIKHLSAGYKGAIGYSYVVNKNNYMEMEQATVIAKEIGCSYIQFKPMIHPTSRGLVEFDEIHKDAIRQIVNSIKKYQTQDFKVMVNRNLISLLDGEPYKVSKSYSYCWTQELRTLITPSGVYVCPYYRGNPSKMLGNINNDTLQSIWNSEKRKKLVMSHDSASECNFYCIRNDVNEFLESIIGLRSKGINILPHLHGAEDEDNENCIFI